MEKFIQQLEGGGLLSDDHNYFRFHSDSSIDIGSGSESKSKNKFSINFTIKYLGSWGICSMKSFPFQGIFFDDSNGTLPGSDNTYTTTENDTGSVNITYFDGSINPFSKGTILSGTFQMDAVNRQGKVIHITDGRFDIGR